MKNLKFFAACLGVGVAMVTFALPAAPLLSPWITGCTVSNNQLVLTWTNGRPSYQVQMRSAPAQKWSNCGTSTTNQSAVIPLSSSRGYFRIVSDYTARYQVVFNTTWSQATHPSNFPAGPHLTALVGGVHSDAVHFYREGQFCSEGIRLMSAYGQQPVLLAEVGVAITNGTADFTLSGPGVNPSPGSATYVFPQAMRRDFPLVTLTSMIGPSPDWFLGVDGFNLLENDQWVSNKVAILYVMDAGTLYSPTNYTGKFITSPQAVITKMTGFPALVNGNIVPFGTFTFTRLD